jgi:hypothetical protein
MPSNPCSVVFEYVAQFFFQLPLGEHILHPTPRGLATLARSGGFGTTLRALNQRIEIMRFFGFAKKLIIDIKMFVFAFTHCSRKAPEKPLKSIGSIGPMHEAAHYIGFHPAFN